MHGPVGCKPTLSEMAIREIFHRVADILLNEPKTLIGTEIKGSWFQPKPLKFQYLTAT